MKPAPRLEDLIMEIRDKGQSFEREVWRIKRSRIIHHPTQPAIRFKNGKHWTWLWMNEEHRWDGPATNWRGGYGYWIHGRELTHDEWLVDPERLEWLRSRLEGI